MLTTTILAVTLAAGNVAVGEPTVIWLNAYEIEPSGIDIAEAGVYCIWVWAREDEPVSVTVGEKELKAEKKGKKKPGHAWTKAGELELKPGKVAIKLGETVAAVALSTSDSFDPNAAMDDIRVLDQPDAVQDRRAKTVRHTDTVFTMPEFRSIEQWEAFAAKLRKRILLSSGLWPLPERNPLNAEIFGRIAHDDYTVEKVHFEARPGFLVTGNLYRPVGQGPYPGVLCPHGHWEHGRLENVERGSIAGRCITLARMGMVAFSYDMVAYNDSLQFKEHRWVDPLEKLWGIHPFAVQLWSGMRAVDFLETLPEVDTGRLACTGASGGGTQTFALMAVDPRIKVAAPVNMISSTMQGGCICENAPIIRYENSNMKVGALMAPRPLLLISATGDWTRETPRVEFPAIRSIYRLYDAEDRVENVHIDAGHNYNQASREAMYRFFGKWLLDDSKWTDFEEPPFSLENEQDLRVFPDGKLPDGLPTSEQVIEQTIEANKAKWRDILPDSPEELAAFREQYGDTLALVLGVESPEPNDLVPERVGFKELEDCVIEHWILRRPCVGDAIPAILYRSRDPGPQDAVLIVHGKGKAALADLENGKPGPLVEGLMAQGKAVMTIDTFLIGEHHTPWRKTRRVTVGAFSDTFQPTDTACRIQDVLTALTYLRFRRDLTERVDLIGIEEGGLWALFGGAVDGKTHTNIIDANQFDPDNDQAWVDSYYAPCIRSVGDVDTAFALLAPRRLVLFNTPPTFSDGLENAYSRSAPDAEYTATPDALSAAEVLSALH